MENDDKDMYGDDNEDDEDYVPESLRGFLEEAENKLQSDLDDVMNFDNMEPHKPKAVPDPHAFDHDEEGEDGDNAIFLQILANEQDQDLKSDLLEGLNDHRPRPPPHHTHHHHTQSPAAADFLSPPQQQYLPQEESTCSDFTSPRTSDLTSLTNNPANDLTESQAKRIAMEGVTPNSRGASRPTNLIGALDDVAAQQSHPLDSVQETLPTAPAATATPQSKTSKRRQRRQANAIANAKQVTPVEHQSASSASSSSSYSMPMSLSVSAAPSSSSRNHQPVLAAVAATTSRNTNTAQSYVSASTESNSIIDNSVVQASRPKAEPLLQHVSSDDSSSLSQAMEQWGKPQQQQSGGVTRRPIPSSSKNSTSAKQTEQHPNVLRKQQQVSPSPPPQRARNPVAVPPQQQQQRRPSPPQAAPQQQQPPQQQQQRRPSPPQAAPQKQQQRPSPTQPLADYERTSVEAAAFPLQPPTPELRPPPATESSSSSSPGRPMVVTIPVPPVVVATWETAFDVIRSTMNPPLPTKEASSKLMRGGGVSSEYGSNNNNMAVAERESYSNNPNPYRTPSRSSPTAAAPSSSSSINPRLLQGTAASTAKYARHRRGPPPGPDQRRTTVRVATDARGRRQLTAPAKISGRLLQATSASKARFTKESSNSTSTGTSTSASRRTAPVSNSVISSTSSSRLRLATTTRSSSTSQAATEEQLEATKARVRARIELQKRKQTERDQGIQDRIRKRQEEQRQKKEKMQATLNRARGKRERMETLERERVDKLMKSIAEKEAKSKLQLMAGKENRPAVPKSMGLIRPRKVATPTIPIAPSFATDNRFKNKDKPTRTNEPHYSLAVSDQIFGKGLRADSRPAPDKFRTRPTRASGEKKILTIPQGPKLATRTRHGDKAPAAAPIADVNDATSAVWQTGLRSVSSPPASSGQHKLTIPQTPKFQEIRKRNIAKSTAEKETEEMEYYRSHPFKATPNRMNDLGSAPRSQKPPVHRPLTLPQPFSFQTNTRVEKSHPPSEPKEDPRQEFQYFKARPMPDFSSSRSTPLSGRTPPARRALTTPEPFKLHTEERSSSVLNKPRSSPPGSSAPAFRARAMPDFSIKSGLVIHRQPFTQTPKNKSVQLEPEETYQFKARPLPKFHNSGPPQTITMHSQTLTPLLSSANDDDQPKMFQARPMPNFSKVSHHVKSCDPSKIRSPPPTKKEPDDAELSSPSFRAIKLPNSSQLSIPVKHRNPVKLRSPESVRRPQQPITSPTLTQFQARPVPKMLSTPSIPVRDRDPTRLRPSPDNFSPRLQRSPLSPEATQFHARPVPSTLTSPSIPVRGRDPAKLRSPDYVLNKVQGTQEKVDPPIFKARPVPDFFKGRDPSPQKGCHAAASPDPKGESPPKARFRERTAKERVRERMMPKTGGSIKTETTKKRVRDRMMPKVDPKKPAFSSSNVRGRLQQVDGVQSPIAGSTGVLCGVPATITMSGMGDTTNGVNGGVQQGISPAETQNQIMEENAKKILEESKRRKMEKRRKEEALEAARELQRPTSVTTDSMDTSGIYLSSEEESKMMLLRATESWLSAEESDTPRAGSLEAKQGFAQRGFSDPPSSNADEREDAKARREAARRKQLEQEEEYRRTRREEETIKMAQQLQHAAEEELSFHGSLQSGEQGYRGYSEYM